MRFISVSASTLTVLVKSPFFIFALLDHEPRSFFYSRQGFFASQFNFFSLDFPSYADQKLFSIFTILHTDCATDPSFVDYPLLFEQTY